MPRSNRSNNAKSSSPNNKTTTSAVPMAKLYTGTPRSRSSSRDSTANTTLTEPPLSLSGAAAATVSDHYYYSHYPHHQQQHSSPLRGRFNSRDLPRTYSGQYASSGDVLMPLECLQQEQFLQAKVSTGVFFCMYASLIFVMQISSTILCMILLEMDSSGSSSSGSGIQQQQGNSNSHNHKMDYSSYSWSWTLTNLIHLIFSLIFIHFNKGSFLVGIGEQGELNAMTVWEQLEATPESSTHMRRTLLIVPTILSYMAICICNFETVITLLNVAIWSIAMVPKLSVMNGVRLFGINRTAGIDDEYEYDTTDDTTTNTTTTDERQQQQQHQQQLLFFMNATDDTNTATTTTTETATIAITNMPGSAFARRDGVPTTTTGTTMKRKAQ